MKAILVTGASTGIGKQSCQDLADKGYLVFAGVRKLEDGEQFKNNPNISPIILDITKKDQIESALLTIEKRVGDHGLYGLFNNAGIALGGPLELLPLEEIRFQFEVNVVAQISILQSFLPLLRKAKKARILFTGSQSGYFTKPYVAPYSASKHALEAIVNSLRYELREMNIFVSMLQPGVIKTPIWLKSLKAGDAVEAKMDKTHFSYYQEDMAFLKKGVELSSKIGISVNEVSAKVIHAFESDQPKIRYKIGRDAKIGFLLSRLPDSWREALVWKKIEKLKQKLSLNN